MSIRTERVGGAIQEEIARMLLRSEIHDPGLAGGVVSVAEVEVSRDLEQAQVFITVMGEEEGQRRALEAMNRAAGFIRTQLGRRLQLRRVPALVFKLDRSLEVADRMNRLFSSLQIPPAEEVDETNGDGRGGE